VDNSSNNLDFAETDLDDSMWQNRKLLKKNVLVNNLASIIDMHKSNTWNNTSLLIDSQTNERFESNLNKIESTPAYLLPKVGSFCSDLLRSMLHRLDGSAGGGGGSAATVADRNGDGEAYSNESESEAEDMDLGNNGDLDYGNKGETKRQAVLVS